MNKCWKKLTRKNIVVIRFHLKCNSNNLSWILIENGIVFFNQEKFWECKYSYLSLDFFTNKLEIQVISI